MNKIHEDYEMNLFNSVEEEDDDAESYLTCSPDSCEFYKPNCICRYLIKNNKCSYIKNDWSVLPW